LQRRLKGTYVSVEPFHLARYVDEQVFRYNYRATKERPRSDADRFKLAMAQVAGRRLTYFPNSQAEINRPRHEPTRTGETNEVPF
jgi:hypothetical protein